MVGLHYIILCYDTIRHLPVYNDIDNGSRSVEIEHYMKENLKLRNIKCGSGCECGSDDV